MVVGPALMFLNNHILLNGFPYPLTLSSLGLLTSSVFSHLAVRIGLVKIRKASLEAVSGRNCLFSALPIGVCKAIGLAGGNAAYLHLGVGFIQMLKSFTPVLVMILMRLAGVVSPTPTAMACICIIVAGTLLEVTGNLEATTIGLCLMLSAEVAEAMNLVLTQKVLQNCKLTVWEGMYTIAPPSFLFLSVCAAFIEWPSLCSHGSIAILHEQYGEFASAGVLGFVVNFCGLAVVQSTSSLLCKVLNTVRGSVIVVIGVCFHGEVVTQIEFLGYCLAIAGFSGYNWAQMFPKQSKRLEHRLGWLCCGFSAEQVLGGDAATTIGHCGETLRTSEDAASELQVLVDGGPAAASCSTKSPEGFPPRVAEHI